MLDQKKVLLKTSAAKYVASGRFGNNIFTLDKTSDAGHEVVFMSILRGNIRIISKKLCMYFIFLKELQSSHTFVACIWHFYMGYNATYMFSYLWSRTYGITLNVAIELHYIKCVIIGKKFLGLFQNQIENT